MDRYRTMDNRPNTKPNEPVVLYGEAALRFLEEIFEFVPKKKEDPELLKEQLPE